MALTLPAQLDFGGSLSRFLLCRLMPSSTPVLPVNCRLSLKARPDLGSMFLAKTLQDCTEHHATSLVFSGRPLFVI